jgi:hypothetical protein
MPVHKSKINLIKPERLYRILAVKRSNENDDRSETLVYEPDMLSEVSADTLTPLYSVMGIRFSNQQFVQAQNIIVEDVITYFYLTNMASLIPEMSKIHFIPASDLQSISLLINILAGWKLDYGILLFGANKKDFIKKLEKETLLKDSNKRVKLFRDFNKIEDIFSAVDFKKYVLLKRIGLIDKNSDYIISNNLSRNILAANFVNKVYDNKLTLDDFDETTKENVKEMFQGISSILKY